MHTKHLIPAAVLWVIVTAIGETLLLVNLFPTVGSLEADDFDWIFRFLLALGIPVFAMVIAAIAYSMYAFRSDTGDEMGATIRGHGWFPRIWLIVTGGLAAFVMVYPGLTGLHKLQSDRTAYGWGAQDADVVIEATGAQFNWSFKFADGTEVNILKGKELVLPVDSTVRFNINSVDVIHSLWIPAFRMKIDAIPGRTTYMTVEPKVKGDYATDQSFRVQCAELCGLDHSVMNFPIRVVDRAEFDQWLASLKTGAN
ncbi:MAG: cytochrome c oxidase subunit II [Dehalococcoidia bacterium]